MITDVYRNYIFRVVNKHFQENSRHFLYYVKQMKLNELKY